MAGQSLPKRTFVDYLELVAWQLVIYRDLLLDMNPGFDLCPKKCFRIPEKKDGEYCKGCDAKIAREAYKDATKQELTKEFGKDWEKQYTFENLEETAIFAYSQIEEPDSTFSVATSVFVNILRSADNRHRRLKFWEDKQRAEAAAERSRNGG